MAAKNEFFKSRLFYFISFVVLIYVSSYVQSSFLAQMASPWFHIDFVSIIIVYLCLEKHILFAAFQAILAGCLMQVASTSPHVFFILYFLLLIVLADLISRIFVINSFASKNLVFVCIYLVKFILFYFSLTDHQDIGVQTLISVYWKEYIATAIVSFLFYPLLLSFDSLFLLPGTIKSGKFYGR